MPDADKGTVTAATDTAAPPSTDVLEGFSADMVGFGDPEGVGSGQPAEAKAVETSAEDEAPEVDTDKPKAETPAEPAKTEDKPDAAKTVNFDGFSDGQRKTWERLLKDGHATPGEVEEARKDSLRQSYFSKETAKLARERETFETEMAERKEDLALLDKIRGDDRLHDAWMKMSKGEVATEESDPDALVDKKSARQIAKETYKEESAADKAERLKAQEQYAAKSGALAKAVQEEIRLLGVTPEVMKSYLEAEAAELPEGIDPILHYANDPTQLRRLVSLRHRVAVAEAKAQEAERQLTQRTSKDVRASKQSLPPARRVAEARSSDPLKQTEADLGIAPDWSNVQGWGFREAR